VGKKRHDEGMEEMGKVAAPAAEATLLVVGALECRRKVQELLMPPQKEVVKTATLRWVWAPHCRQTAHRLRGHVLRQMVTVP